MKCKQCKRSVRDSFMDKMRHMFRFHPDMFARGLFSLVVTLPDLSKRTGAAIADNILTPKKGTNGPKNG